MTPGSIARWRAGIIAAGLGERLQGFAPSAVDGPAPGGVERPVRKPLVPVAGRALIEHVLASMAEAQPEEAVIIVNEASLAVKEHVSARQWPFPIRWIVETTPSSMHSFLRVLETLAQSGGGGPFLMSTVDTIAPKGAFAAFAAAAARSRADVTLAIAPPPDDEKPLLVELASNRASNGVGHVSDPYRKIEGSDPIRVAAIGEAAAGSSWATSGYYAVRASVLREADAARRDKLTALRAFLARLIARGYAVDAVPVAPGVDVDRPADVAAAEHFLRQAEA
jgi:NDP-sugar pyrophosphorylase family protein